MKPKVVDAKASDSEVELDEDEELQVIADMQDAQDDLEARDTYKPKHFVVEPRGGKRNKKIKNKTVDSYRCRPAAGLPTEFIDMCLPWGKRTVTNYFSVYDKKSSMDLCWTWGLLMEAYYMQCIEQKCSKGAMFDPVDIKDVCDPAVEVVVKGLDAKHPISSRWDCIAKQLPSCV